MLSKPRQEGQIDQWKEAIGWYLEWLRFAVEAGEEVHTLEEWVFLAMDRADGRFLGFPADSEHPQIAWVGKEN